MPYRILYIMNVDWDWVKQRPHFIAQHLSRAHNVVVLYPYAWRRAHVINNQRDGVRAYRFYRFPFGGKVSFVRKLNAWLFRAMSKAIIKWHRSEIVWISSPELFAYLPRMLTPKLVYDCMDDILAFSANAPHKGWLEANEKELVSACSHVFCSSANLRDKIVARAGYPEKCSVVHNAFEPSSFSILSDTIETKPTDERHIIGYVGTISSWLDSDAIIKAVRALSSIEFHFVGPIDNVGRSLPQHERIKYLGAVRHSDLPSYVRRFDALIMPFLVTELIQSVDPVKLYEYVFFNKPIVSIRYLEIERFSEFVDFYMDHAGLIEILNRYVHDGFKKKYSGDARSRFIAANTWTQRVSSIEQELHQIGAISRDR